MLGPIPLLKLKMSPKTLGRRLVAELWLYPDGARILELSTKCAPGEALPVALETRAFLTERGIDLSGKQQTKTRTALTFFSKELKAAAAEDQHLVPAALELVVDPPHLAVDPLGSEAPPQLVERGVGDVGGVDEGVQAHLLPRDAHQLAEGALVGSLVHVVRVGEEEVRREHEPERAAGEGEAGGPRPRSGGPGP